MSFIDDLDAALVPLSPYNLIPPQILATQMKSRGYSIRYFHHDNANYIFTYRYNVRDLPIQTLTIPISKNYLFQFRTNEGYTRFMSCAGKYQPSYKSFVGSTHFIPLEDQDDTSSYLPCDNENSHGRTSQSHDKTREIPPTTIPYHPLDFASRTESPISTIFDTTQAASIPDDPITVAYRKVTIPSPYDL